MTRLPVSMPGSHYRVNIPPQKRDARDLYLRAQEEVWRIDVDVNFHGLQKGEGGRYYFEITSNKDIKPSALKTIEKIGRLEIITLK